MNRGTERLRELLDAEGVEYQMIHHTRDYRARATAAHTHTPADRFAKTVLVAIDGTPAMAVVPANRTLALSFLRDALGAERVEVVRESELRELCPDCELGAVPAIGPLYDLPVYVSTALQGREITMDGGDHEHAFRMPWTDFERLASPRVLPLAHHDPPR
jgi:Ala-tRNA(Pro) deacylase